MPRMHSPHHPRARRAGTAGGLALLAAALLTCACGLGRPSPPVASDHRPSPSPVASLAPARPMAKLPAGVVVPLVKPGLLTVCSHLGGAPYVYTDSRFSDKVSGFDVDVLNLVGQRLGVQVLFVETDPRQFLTGQALNQNRCDVIAGSFSAIPETAQYFDATAPYLKRDFGLLVQSASSAKSLDGLAGKRVGVMKGTLAEDYLTEYNASHGGRIVAVPVNDSSLSVAGLKANQFDAVLFESPTAYYYAHQSPGQLHVAAEVGPSQDVNFGVRRGNTALHQQIDAALADAGGNGQYAKAYVDWFGRPPSWVPGP
jgi:polar amino acid transport system substrate-binding protein